MNLDYTLIGSRVNDLRKSQGISQERLAELADLSTTFISHIERSNKKPSLGALIRLASALGVTVDFLLAGNQPSDRNAYMPDVENLLSDCSMVERRIVFEVATATKKSLRDTHWDMRN